MTDELNSKLETQPSDLCNLCNRKPCTHACWSDDCTSFGDMGEYCEECFDIHNEARHS